DPSTTLPHEAVQPKRSWRHLLSRATPSPSRRPRRERSPLGWITLGALLVVVGGAAGFDQAGIVSPSPGQYVALAVTVIGLGLLAGAWWGRARWMAVLGLLLLPVVLLASLIQVPLVGGFGQRSATPASSADLRSPYRIAGG